MNQQNPLNSVPEFRQLIEAHAYHSFMADYYRSQGQPVPLQHSQAVAEVTQLAQTYLPPELLPQAQAMAQMRKTELGQESRQQQITAQIATQLKSYKDSTKGIAGLKNGVLKDSEQAKQIRDGAESLKVPNEGAPRNFNQKEIDTVFKKRFDGLTEGNMKWYANRRGTPEYDAMVKKTGRDPGKLSQMLDSYESERDQFEFMKHRSKRELEEERQITGDMDYEPPAEIEVPITESDRRRLALADAFDKHRANVDEPDPSEWISDEMRENAAESSVNMQEYETRQAEQQGRPSHEVSDRRDDIIAAFDTVSTQQATE